MEHDAHSEETTTTPEAGLGRRGFIAAAVSGGAALTVAGAGTASATIGSGPSAGDSLGAPARTHGRAVPRRQTRIGIGYETWFDAVGWDRPEAVPVLGTYSSLDEKVIRQHAKWITYAGLDHILIDWSNNLGGNWTSGTAEKIIAGTNKLLEVYAKLPASRRPDVTLLVGLDNGQAGTENFNAQIDLIKKNYLAKASYRRMFLLHDGKPLISVYTGARTTVPPTWNDPALTVRWMGAFREIVLNPGGQWSWTDRVAYANGVETPIADFTADKLKGWKVTGEWAVDTIKTHQALRIDVETVAATSKPADGVNQKAGTLTSPPFTITERAFAFNAIGFDMSSGDDLRTLNGRNVFLLKDAQTNKILRHTTPPGDEDRFYVRQWNVADLLGREVVFQAVNNSTNAGLTGWIGFTNPVQQRPEQMTAVVATAGNQAPGAFLNWDAHSRNSGANLVEMMSAAFDYEPELLTIQQWNEFGRPDQYSVAGSNDIEPTVLNKLAGAKSDGWGFYYLKLVRDLVDQYRAGKPFPAVMLDTRYP